MKLDPNYDDYDYPTTSPAVQSGHPGHTTPEQDAQVHQLRMQLESAGYKERLDTLSMVCSSSFWTWEVVGTEFFAVATISTSTEVQRRSGEANVRFA